MTNEQEEGARLVASLNALGAALLVLLECPDRQRHVVAGRGLVGGTHAGFFHVHLGDECREMHCISGSVLDALLVSKAQVHWTPTFEKFLSIMAAMRLVYAEGDPLAAGPLVFGIRGVVEGAQDAGMFDAMADSAEADLGLRKRFSMPVANGSARDEVGDDCELLRELGIAPPGKED